MTRIDRDRFQAPAAPGKRQYRRRWKRSAADHRLAAAGALDSLFQHRRVSKALGILLAVSLAAHVRTDLPVDTSGSDSQRDVAAAQDSYAAKIRQKEVAKGVSKKLAGRITMPPPPTDPEAFVSRTMQDSITKDIENVIGNLLDVKVTGKITDKVSSSLKDELNAAAKKIAEQKLTPEQIADIQKTFRDRANREVVTAIQEHRVETQTQRAAISTTQWYDEKVRRVLFTNLAYEMYGRPDWTIGPRMWYTSWPGGSGVPQWHTLNSIEELSRRHRYLERCVWKAMAVPLEAGNRPAKDAAVDPAKAPVVNLEQVRALKREVNDYYNRHAGGYKNQEILPSWGDLINSGTLCYGLVNEFYPHMAEPMQKRIDEVDAQWQKTLADLDALLQKCEEGGSAADIRPLQAAFFTSGLALVKQIEGLFPSNALHNSCTAVYRAILLEHLRNPELQKQHWDRWVESMVQTLWPLIQTYAEGQFKEGIIKYDGKVEEAIKSFPAQIQPLLRRDVLRLMPREKWNTLIFYPYQFTSKITGDRSPPSDEDFKGCVDTMNQVLAKEPAMKVYADKERQLIADHFAKAVDNNVAVIRKHVFARGLLTRNISELAEGVDYSDKVQEKVDATQAAREGRGQDLSRLNKDGLPDTAARLVALQYGLARGSLVEPVACPEAPGFSAEQRPENAIRGSFPSSPPAPVGWKTDTQQPEVKCPFPDSPRYESIPFLSRFPRLDGDLADWGRIRPLVLTPVDSRGDQILLYAAWNYQGFFFGYKVRQPANEFYYPEQYRMSADKRPDWAKGGAGFTGAIRAVREQGYAWMMKGDYLRLMFDTLDARSATRGDPHTQEFVVLPMGSDTDPTLPGFERVIDSRRDATATEWRGVVATGKMFPQQPPPDPGPDGSGPYRVTRTNDRGPVDQQGYTTEVFMPRSLFKAPVFAPGWHIGFDCAVATGIQNRFRGQMWSPQRDAADERQGGTSPRKWGDLLLLGTDPFIVLQETSSSGAVAKGVIPGHSYLMTVIDPDRNIYPTARDSILVSAEVTGKDQDMEVFTLLETENNSGVFCGYINTQPGRGRQVQGVLECSPGQEIRFGYVDIGTAKGKRNVIFELRVPVVGALAAAAQR